MAIINLRDYYPFYQSDQFVEVPDELVVQMQQWKRDEKAYQRKRNRYQAYFSLDRNSGMERDVLFVSITPDEHYERRLTYKQLYRALSSLPDKQAKRITAHYVLGISQADIARAEGVSRNVVFGLHSPGIEKVGGNFEKYLKEGLQRDHFCHRVMRSTFCISRKFET